jgi:hypothetical protein
MKGLRQEAGGQAGDFRFWIFDFRLEEFRQSKIRNLKSKIPQKLQQTYIYGEG